MDGSGGPTDVRAEGRARLLARLRSELGKSVLAEATEVAAHATGLHGHAIGPVIFYGSCLRASSPEGVMDVYLLSRSHRAFHGRSLGGSVLAALNALVPPNIYFWSIPHPVHGALRVKVAVVSQAQFQAQSEVAAWSPSIWARFCQPCVQLAGGSAGKSADVEQAILTACLTAAHWAAHLGPESGTSRDFWTALFAATYGAELRPERADRPSVIYDADPERYDAVLRDAWSALGVAFTEHEGVLEPKLDASMRRSARRAFRARQLFGKALTLVRIVKGTLTFRGGIDYLAWKIERHSGVSLGLREWERRHPVLAAPVVLARLLRAGALR